MLTCIQHYYTQCPYFGHKILYNIILYINNKIPVTSRAIVFKYQAYSCWPMSGHWSRRRGEAFCFVPGFKGSHWPLFTAIYPLYSWNAFIHTHVTTEKPTWEWNEKEAFQLFSELHLWSNQPRTELQYTERYILHFNNIMVMSTCLMPWVAYYSFTHL